MRKMRILAMGMCAAMTLSLAACGGGSSSSTTTAAGGDGGTTEASSDSTGGGSGQQLIIYTNSGSNGRDAWLKEQASEQGFNIEVVQIRAGDLGNRIISEKNNMQADLVFGNSSYSFSPGRRPV